MSLTTELERPQPRASIASASRRCSTGRSALARQADTCSTYPPPVAESPVSAATLSTSRARPATAASAPISCGWNPSPRTEPNTWPSAATMATSVLLLPASMASTPDRASRAQSRPWQVLPVVGQQTVGQAVGQLHLADQWMGQQGAEHALPSTFARGAQSEVLVRRDGRDQAREQRVERRRRAAARRRRRRPGQVLR